MSNIIYLTLEGDIQGKISAGCGSQASVGNRYQLGHEDEIFVFSLTQAVAGVMEVSIITPAILQTPG
jgi:type VI secretion system Hcp family effector